jgi:hypothetical protein
MNSALQARILQFRYTSTQGLQLLNFAQRRVTVGNIKECEVEKNWLVGLMHSRLTGLSRIL